MLALTVRPFVRLAVEHHAVDGAVIVQRKEIQRAFSTAAVRVSIVAWIAPIGPRRCRVPVAKRVLLKQVARALHVERLEAVAGLGRFEIGLGLFQPLGQRGFVDETRTSPAFTTD